MAISPKHQRIFVATLLKVASEMNNPEFKYESVMEITESTIFGVTFGFLYEQMMRGERN